MRDWYELQMKAEGIGDARLPAYSNKEPANTSVRINPSSKDRKRKMIREVVMALLAIFVLASLLGVLSGCNTLEGAGKDIERAGKAIKEEATLVRNKM